MSYRVSSENPVPLTEVEKILKEREEIAPLNYIQRVTLDHAHRFSDMRAGKDLADLIMDTFELDRLVSVQIVNVCPKSLDDITAVLGESTAEKDRQKIFDFYTKHVASQPEIVVDDDDEEEEEDDDDEEDSW